MIIKTSEMSELCSQFLKITFKPAFDEFHNWVIEEVLPKHKELNGFPYFVRNGQHYLAEWKNFAQDSGISEITNSDAATAVIFVIQTMAHKLPKDLE